MNENYPEPSDELLESTFSAMRARPIPDGPSDEVMEQTIAALREVAAPKPGIFRRISGRMFTLRMAASILTLIGLVVLTLVMLRSPDVTLGEIVEKVRSAHSLSFLVTATTANVTTHMKMLMNDQGQMCGQSDEGARMIWDFSTGRMLMLDGKSRTAMEMDMKDLGTESPQPGDLIEGFKQIQGDSARDLGAAEIDGREAEKFIATQARIEYTVWADRRTREPIRIDIAVNMLGKRVTTSITDFQLNIEIPAGSFDMNVPSGFMMQRFSVDIPDVNKGEQNLIDLLRGYAKRSGGKFPANLDDMSLYIKLVIRPGTTRPVLEQADMQWIIQYQMVQSFLGTLPKDGWKYLGEGKSAREEKSLIFWYRKDAGYRGVFSDLTAAELPVRPK